MLFPITENNLTGFINSTGEVVIERQLRHAFPFSEGIAAVPSDFHWGFINEHGDWRIEPAFSWCNSFADELAAVSVAGEKGYINATGKLVLPGPYYKCGDFSGGIACVQRDWKDPGVLTNRRGDAVGDTVFPLSEMADGLVNCRSKDQWGYANVEGEFEIPPVYDAAYPFREGLAAVDSGGHGQFHFID